MTLEQFLSKLATTAEQIGWVVMDDGRIRSFNLRCPMEILAGNGTGGYYGAAEWLGLGADLRDRICGAADYRSGSREGHNELRQRLLTAVGLRGE